MQLDIVWACMLRQQSVGCEHLRAQLHAQHKVPQAQWLIEPSSRQRSDIHTHPAQCGLPPLLVVWPVHEYLAATAAVPDGVGAKRHTRSAHATIRCVLHQGLGSALAAALAESAARATGQCCRGAGCGKSLCAASTCKKQWGEPASGSSVEDGQSVPYVMQAWLCRRQNSVVGRFALVIGAEIGHMRWQALAPSCTSHYPVRCCAGHQYLMCRA